MQGLVFLVPALLAPRVTRPGDLALPLLLGTSVEQEAVALLEAPRPAVYDGRVLVLRWRPIARVLQELRLVAQPHPVMRVGHGGLAFQGHLLVPVLEGEGGTIDEEDEDGQAEDPQESIHADLQIAQAAGSLHQVAGPAPAPRLGQVHLCREVGEVDGDGLQLALPRQPAPVQPAVLAHLVVQQRLGRGVAPPEDPFLAFRGGAAVEGSFLGLLAPVAGVVLDLSLLVVHAGAGVGVVLAELDPDAPHADGQDALAFGFLAGLCDGQVHSDQGSLAFTFGHHSGPPGRAGLWDGHDGLVQGGGRQGEVLCVVDVQGRHGAITELEPSADHSFLWGERQLENLRGMGGGENGIFS